MMYGKVVDGEVVEYSSKPVSKRISNLWLNTEAMKAEGWLPVDDQKPELMPWQSLGARSEIVMATKIKWTYAVIEQSLDDYKAKKLKELNKNASAEFDRVAPSYKQLNLSLGRRGYNKNSGKGAEMLANMDLINNEVDAKEALILAAGTHEAVDLVYTGIVAFSPFELDDNGFPIVPEPEI